MKFKCIWFSCSKKWSEKPTRTEIIIHHFDRHGSNLSFLSQQELECYVKVDEPDLKVEKE